MSHSDRLLPVCTVMASSDDTHHVHDMSTGITFQNDNDIFKKN